METEKSCKIGFAITGSFCTHEKIKEIIQDMVDDGMDIIPIFSENVQTIDSRFGKAEVFTEQIEEYVPYRLQSRSDRTEIWMQWSLHPVPEIQWQNYVAVLPIRLF